MLWSDRCGKDRYFAGQRQWSYVHLGDLAAELQVKVWGVALTRLFVGQARVRAAFVQEYTIATQTMPFTLTMKTSWGVVKFEVSPILLPGG